MAAVNGSAHTVVSGAAEIVDAVAAPFAERGVRTSTLQVSHPFHSPLMAPMVEAFGAVVAEVELSAPDRRVVSNVTGAVVGAELADPDYWVRHVLAPVRFADGVEAMRAAGVDVFVEIGPHPVLVGMAAADAPAPGEVWFGSLRRGRDDHRQVLGALAGVWAAGAPVAWDLVESAGAGATPATLPATVFRREPYWMAPTTLATGAPAAPVGPDELNPILGRRLPSPLAAVTFEAALTTQRLPILADHRVFGATILPATAFLEAALDALAEVTGGTELQQVLIHEPLVAGPEPVTMHTVVQPADGGVAVEVFSLHGTGWRRHLTARGPANPGALSPATDLTAARARVTREVGADEHYATLAANDLDFGPTLRGVQRIWVGPDEVLGELATTGDDHTRYRANPALVDAAVQVIAAAATDGGIHLPFSIDRVEWRRPVGDRATSHVVLGGAGQGTLTADVEVLDESGTPSVVLHGLILKHADPSVLRRAGGADASPLHRVVWEPVDVAVASGDTSLIDPGRLASAAAEGIDSLPTRFDLVEYQGLLDALEELSTGYVLAALRGLGVELVPGRRFSPAELPVVPAHRELLGELLDLLVDDGVLRRWGDQLEVVEAPVVDLGEARLDALLECYPRGRGELALTSRCGTGLADALRGDADPLQLLFPGGSVADAEHMYQHSPFSMATAAQVGDAVAAIGAAGGPTRPLRVLEIGGGTGGTTSCVLDHLPPGSSYTFTDISPHFLPRARTKFADFPSFETMLLDIEGDLRAQGLDGRRFDLVVGANVLHATADLAATFANVGRLLAPGGLLVMSEMVRPQRFISITFGLTEGWWRFRDRELRPASLLLDRDGWVEFLAGAGYRDPVAVANTGADTPDGMGVQAVILAGAPDGPSVELAAGQRSWLVLGDGGGVGDDLAAAVRARGGEAVVVADATRADLDTAVAAAPPGGFDVAVHLWALDAPADAEAEVATRLRRPLGGAFDLVQTVLAASPNTRVCLVTRGAQGAGATVPDPDQAALWGLSRTLRLEHPELATMVVDLDPSPVALVGPDLLDALLAGDGEDEVALRAGTRLVPRLRPAAAPDSAPSTPQVLTFAARGAIDELVVRPAERRPPGVGEVEIEVLAAALNFKDVLNVLDMYPGDPGPLGGECAGIVTSVGAGVTHLAVGDAVMAVAPGSMRTFVTCDATMVVPKPAGTGFAEAAGTLIAHVTARFALDEVAGLQAGERVLVHAAAGGVGLAAVAAAQRVGAEVFATAGSERKRALLRALGVAHVYDSRSLDFAEGVMADTDGAGVDVVLNSLTGEAVARSIDVLAEGGRFVEIGKRGLVDGGFPSGRSYHVVDWGATAQDDPARVRALVDGVVADARAGSLLRLPFRTYAFDDARAAFRLMAQGRHVGKVVLAMPAADARPTPAVRSEATYLVTGGLGGLGLLTAGHLVAQGARRVVLMGRHEPTSGALEAIDAMRADGVEVVVALGDVARADDVERAVAAADVDGFPLRGVFHAAGTLDDGAVGQLTWDRIAPVLRAKIDGPAHLDRATRHIPLDLFVAYGSIASYVGSPGQANHAAGNTALDAYAVARAASGRRGMTIAWGAWAEVGAAVDRGIADQALARGQRSFTVAEGLAALDECLELGAADVAASSIDWARLAQRFAGHPPPILADLVERATPVAAAPSVVASSAVPDGLRERLASAPAARRPTMVLDLVRGQAAHVLALPAADLGDSTPLSELGLDSLMAVELRNLLGTQLALDEPLPATLVFDHPSVQAIAEHLTTVLVDVFPVSPAPAEPEGSVAATGSPDRRPSSASASVSSLLDDLENLSDEELEARFLRKDEP